MNIVAIAKTLSEFVSAEPDAPLARHTIALKYLGHLRNMENACGNLRWDFSLDGRDDYVICVGNRAVFIDPKTGIVTWEPREPASRGGEYRDSSWRNSISGSFRRDDTMIWFALVSKKPSGQLSDEKQIDWDEFPEGMG